MPPTPTPTPTKILYVKRRLVLRPIRKSVRGHDTHLLRLQELREHLKERVEQGAGQQHERVARGYARDARVLPEM